jgi:hypothetical protein
MSALPPYEEGVLGIQQNAENASQACRGQRGSDPSLGGPLVTSIFQHRVLPSRPVEPNGVAHTGHTHR